MSNSRCFSFLIFIILIFSGSGVHGEIISGDMFGQLGKQTLNQIDNGFGRSDGLYNNGLNNNWADFAWGQGIMFGANVAAAKVDPSRIAKAEKQAQEMYNSYRCYQDGYWAFNASRNNCGDRYYDDNAWIALAYLELYEVTGNAKYLNWAREILIFCMSGENGSGDSPDGGIRWHESNTSGASVCSTAPTILSNLMTYQITGIESYLNDGMRLYWWLVNSNLRLSHWIYHENNQGPLGYQTGVMTQAAVKLFEITGDQEYLNQAQLMAASMEDTFINGTTHALNQHGKWGGHDMTNAYVDLYLVDGNTYWLDVAAGYLEFLYLNCVEPESGLYTYVWSDTTGDYSDGLIDNASVARSYYTMARTEGGQTTNNTFVGRLAGRWTFDQTSGTVASDSSSFGNDGILTGSSFSFDNGAAAGMLNGALSFDGTDDYIDLPDGFANFRSGMTVSVWVYPTAVKNWARFIDIANGASDNNFMLARRGISNDLFFEVYNRGTSGGMVRAVGVIELNKWQLFTATMDLAGNVILYKNGTQIASGKTAIPVNIQRVNAYVGKSNWDADAYYKGRMDDLRIYSYPLSGQDVQQLYFNGGQAEVPLPPDNSINIVESRILSWIDDPYAVSYDVFLGTDLDALDFATVSSPEYKGRQTATDFIPALLPGTTYYWRIDQVNTSNISKGHIWSFTTADLPTDNLMVHYTMDGVFNSGQTIIDASGSPVLSGTLFGPKVVSTGPMPDVLRFDGIDDYIELPDGFRDFSGGLTVSFWAYPLSVDDWARFIDFGNGSTSDNIVFARYGTTNDLSFGIYDGGNDIGKVRASNVIELNKWQMFTATMNSLGYVRLYKNGVFINKGRIAVPRVIDRTENFIGKSNWSNPYFNGGMDDFGFWDRTLTSTEIASMYNRGIAGIPLQTTPDPFAPVVYWSLNEGSGSTAFDMSGNYYDAIVNNIDSANWIDGKQCGGLSFDGVDDYIEASDFKGIAGSGSRTFCAWIKTSASSFPIVNWGAESIGNQWNIQLTPDGKLALGIYGGYIIGSNDLRDDLWHHIAVVLENDGSADVSEAVLYLDGELEPLSASTSYPLNTAVSENVKIGVNFSGSSFSDGAIDEVKIFSRAVSAGDIYQIFSESALSGDFVPDGKINIKDFSVLAYYWQDSDACEIDLNCDCEVNFEDLTIFADQWLSQ